MPTTPKQFRFSGEDQGRIALVREWYGVSSDAEAVRMALNIAIRLGPPAWAKAEHVPIEPKGKRAKRTG